MAEIATQNGNLLINYNKSRPYIAKDYHGNCTTVRASVSGTRIKR